MKNSSNQEVCLLVTDIQYQIERLDLDLKPPTMIIYGNLLHGKPIKVLIKDYLPYFYIEASDEINPNILENAINKQFLKAKCLGVKKVMKKSIYGYSEKEKPFYQVFFNDPIQMKGLVEIVNELKITVDTDKEEKDKKGNKIIKKR